MTIERLAQGIARRFGGLGTSRASFVRIHAWAIAFLLLASSLATSHGPGLASRRQLGTVENVALAHNDQRAFAKSAFSKRKYFHIAWIAGSETEVFVNVLRTDYVSRLMLPLLPKIDGKPVAIDVYYLPAMRVADEYFTLLDALAEHPDLVVMSLNPVWSLNPLSTHQWEQQLDAKAAATLVTRPRSWPIAASFLSPADLAWGLAAAHLKPVAERTYWSDQVHDLVDDLGPLDRSTLAKVLAATKPDRAAQALADPPLEFWFKHRLKTCYPTNLAHYLSTHCDAEGWASWIDRANTMDTALNQTMLHAIAHELKASKIPAYVYLAQVNSGWLQTNHEVQSAVAGLERGLQRDASSFRAKNVLYEPKTVTRSATGLQFLSGDPVHMHDAGTLPGYLATQLCRVLAQTGDTACHPSENGDQNG